MAALFQTVFPPSSNVTVLAVDDIAAPERSGSAGADPGLRHAPLRSGAGGNYDNGTWTPDGGRFWTDYLPGMGYARFWLLPSFCGSPDVSHLDSSADAVEFHALLSDYRGALPSFTSTRNARSSIVRFVERGCQMTGTMAQEAATMNQGSVLWICFHIF